MPRQRTVFERSDKDGRFRVQMEQSADYFEISDLKPALNCLLDLLGGRGVNVVKTVKDLLIASAVQRFPTHKDAAHFLGISDRVLCYDVTHRKALQSAAQVIDIKKER